MPLRWVLALVGVTAAVVAALLPHRSPAPGAAAPVPVAESPAPVLLASPVASVPPPVRLSIPAIDVDTPLDEIAVDGAGTLVPPADFHRAGWFAAGPPPGQIGPAVLAGHVDNRTGPAVFYRLEELTPGARVVVIRADGRAVTFTVTRVAAYPKSRFPTAEVYGPTPDAELRLITCGGTFDRSRRSYTDNVVVFARSG